MIDPRLREPRLVATATMLRQFAGLWLLFVGGLAALLWTRSPGPAAIALAVLALVVGLGGLVWPRLAAPVFSTAMAVATPIGAVVSTVLLAAVFYLVFVPLAAVFRLIGRDMLRRAREPGRQSYWLRKRPSEPAGYFRQS